MPFCIVHCFLKTRYSWDSHRPSRPDASEQVSPGLHAWIVFSHPLVRPLSHHLTITARLVVLGSCLAGLQLLQVPVADLHVAILLVHAGRELLGGTGAVVGVVVLVILGWRGLDLSGRRLCGGAAAEHAADGMAD
jgi:hypothetical protein